LPFFFFGVFFPCSQRIFIPWGSDSHLETTQSLFVPILLSRRTGGAALKSEGENKRPGSSVKKGEGEEQRGAGQRGQIPARAEKRRVSEPGIRRRAQNLCPGNGIKGAVSPSVLALGRQGVSVLAPGNWLDTSLLGTGLILPLIKELMLHVPSTPVPYNPVRRSIPPDPALHSNPAPKPPAEIWL